MAVPVLIQELQDQHEDRQLEYSSDSGEYEGEFHGSEISYLFDADDCLYWVW